MEHITFGEYPQTIKAEDVLLSDAPDERGCYLGSDGCRYVAVTATPHEPDFKFSTGAPIVAGETYYFKVEPIRWKVLARKGGAAFLLSDSVLASRRFDEKSNNYAESEIRSWLNTDFLLTAFTPKEQERILLSHIDNSAPTTGDAKNEYACEDTEDKVFLASHADIKNGKYGFSASFSEDSERARLTSDYSRATGVYMQTEHPGYGNGYWWLRSPSDSRSYGRVRVVFPNGVSDYSYYYPNSEYGSVVPAVWVKL